ncbi:MAG: PD40 domain-containing protein [Anaerolineae bacterium]|nr:PD40 domain-containing protein [Anaerolineae bacterium]
MVARKVAVLSVLIVSLAITLHARAPITRSLPADPPPPRPRGPETGLETIPFLSVEPAVGESPSRATTPVIPWGRLVYQSVRDGNWEIYVADGNGANPVRLTYSPSADIHPRFDRGCTRIAYVVAGSKYYQIYVMAADGSNRQQLTSQRADAVNPDWSPDGTRIVYESYQDGQAEIYVMGADGSNPTRLTWHNGYDGQPSWSPDGGQLAFVSTRAGHYHIWAMRADGSNPVQLSTQPYSEHPTWAPDGGVIGYDADGDGDGWQELWLMGHDGSNQQEIRNSGGPDRARDLWARSWAPDGRHLAYTQIDWIEYGGNWYWTGAELYVWDRDTSYLVERLGSDDTAWNPDLESLDALPPASTVNPLPGWSSSPVTLTWLAEPDDLSGLRGFDIEVKDGVDGEWQRLLSNTGETSLPYPGVGGHTYYFRVRAHDNVFNYEAWPVDYDVVTRVEAAPPRTAVHPLSAFSQPDLLVRWGGVDPGGSGVESYDVQVRDLPDGAWTGWLTATADTSARFVGVPGQSYAFRVRAVDRARNAEAWPPGAGDTETTVYAWRLVGTVHDNTGTPISGAALVTAPPAFLTTSNDRDGAFGVYLAATAPSHLVRWEKEGYGALPDTDFAGLPDATWNVTLPPADNVVADWGFESAALAPNWLPAGNVGVGQLAHTGHFAARIGSQFDLFQDRADVSQSEGASDAYSMAVDASDRVHVAWWDQSAAGSNISYSLRSPDGTWSGPEIVSNVSAPWTSLALRVDEAGLAHLMWRDDVSGASVLLYARRSVQGAWSAPEIISEADSTIGNSQIGLGPDGTVHAAWTRETRQLFYARRLAGGTWSVPWQIDDYYNLSNVRITVDDSGTVHLAWRRDHYVAYAQKKANAAWSGVEIASGSGYHNLLGYQIAVGTAGDVHALWLDDLNTADGWDIYYAARRSDGTWSAPQAVTRSGMCFQVAMAVDDHGGVHAAWQHPIGSYGQIFYARRTSDGSWTEPEHISYNVTSAWAPRITVDRNGGVYLVWLGSYMGFDQVFYTHRRLDGTWSDPQNISHSPRECKDPRAVLQPAGLLHVAWRQEAGDGHDIMHVGPAVAQQSADMALSQVISIPQAADHPTLSFLYQLHGTRPAAASRLDVLVDDGVAASSLFSTAVSTGGWQQQWADLAPWAGQVVTLTWNLRQEAARPYAWAFLDEVSVGSTYPDLWLASEAPTAAALPGDEAVVLLYYSNQGGAVAAGARLTVTLPLGLDLVAADPPPFSTTPELWWDLGDVPGKSEWLAVTIRARVSPEAPPGDYLAYSARIDTATEPETANNEVEGSLLVGTQIHLPVIIKTWP